MPALLGSRILCPYCFKEFSLNQAHFECIPCGKALGPGHVVREGIGRWLPWFANPLRARCKAHPNRVLTPVCPNSACQSQIPHNMNTWGCNLLFAVMGTANTGKTTFLRILNQQIGGIGRPFGWAQQRIGDDTRKWEDAAIAAIMDEGRTLDKTQEVDQEARAPNLYALRGRSCGGVTYAFFDPAGEYMYQDATLSENAAYIEHLDGLLFLVNPLALPKVSQKLGRAPVKANEYTNIRSALERIEQACGADARAIRKKSVAVCLTRSDLIKDMLPSALMEDGGHDGYFNIRDHEQTSREVGDLLEDWLDEGIRNRLGIYGDFGFFAFSALGGDPDKSKKLRHEPQPIRVADPFLWLLWKKKFISGKR